MDNTQEWETSSVPDDPIHDSFKYGFRGTTGLMRGLEGQYLDLFEQPVEFSEHHKPTVNAPSRCGATALHYFIAYGNIEATKWLLANGASVHARTSGDTGC